MNVTKILFTYWVWAIECRSRHSINTSSLSFTKRPKCAIFVDKKNLAKIDTLSTFCFDLYYLALWI